MIGKTWMFRGLMVGALLFTAACETAPVTGRNQLILMPESQSQAMGVDAYNDIKGKTPISNDPKYTVPVSEIGRRIAAVSTQPGLDWEFTVFQDDTPNAFALPGGKVGVNTGLFKVAKTDDQLAAVMAHEVGHVMARHGTERVSTGMATQVGVLLGGLVIGQEYAGLLGQAATLGVVLPYSRVQESEADEIGLIMMAKAGYDPRAAVALWQNFAAEGGARQPEFLSTHPAPETRIKDIEAALPRAMPYYENSPYR
jgi:predicted Zn-dependent protease